MPCCGRLAPPSLLPTSTERGWHDNDDHDVPKRLVDNGAAIVAEAAAALDGDGGRAGFASLEGHGVDQIGGANGAALGPAEAPWRELLLFSTARGWNDANCALVPTACRPGRQK